jgi:hypothetical protein
VGWYARLSLRDTYLGAAGGSVLASVGTRCEVPAPGAAHPNIVD